MKSGSKFFTLHSSLFTCANGRTSPHSLNFSNPPRALVGRNVTFEELSVLLIDARPHWGQCQFAVTHTLSFSSSIANMSANLLAWS